MDSPREGAAAELESLLDEVSYQLTAARAAGLGDTAKLREALRRARNLVEDADALVANEEVARRGPSVSLD